MRSTEWVLRGDYFSKYRAATSYNRQRTATTPTWSSLFRIPHSAFVSRRHYSAIRNPHSAFGSRRQRRLNRLAQVGHWAGLDAGIDAWRAGGLGVNGAAEAQLGRFI